MNDFPFRSARLRVAVVAAGRVATSTAALLIEAGHRLVGVWSRSSPSAARAAEMLGASTGSLEAVTRDAELVLLGVPEEALTPMARALVAHLAPGAIVWHFAGASGIRPLSPIRDAGARPCALHPMASLPSLESGAQRLRSIAWGRTCSPDLEGWADELVRQDLGGVPIAVAEADRAVWHAAAVIAANGFAAVLDAGEAILGAVGVARPQEVLAPLVTTVRDNAREEGAARALTGPIVRGEVAVVQRHLDALREKAPEMIPAYLASAESVRLAAKRDRRLDDEVDRRLRQALAAPWT